LVSGPVSRDVDFIESNVNGVTTNRSIGFSVVAIARWIRGAHAVALP